MDDVARKRLGIDYDLDAITRRQMMHVVERPGANLYANEPAAMGPRWWAFIVFGAAMFFAGMLTLAMLR